MKLTSFLLATVFADGENFATSDNVEWKLSMDSVMGGASVGNLERFDDRLYFSGQLDLINGGFAGFIGNIGSGLNGYKGKSNSRCESLNLNFPTTRSASFWTNTYPRTRL